MRDAFSNQLVDLIKKNENVYLLSGDHGYALFDKLRTEKPNHFINAGIAEQNMIGVGSGMSKLGLYPIMYGLAAFVPIRVLEQIKIDFCYENLPGLFIGDGAGVVYSHLGTSHQSTEDIAATRSIPHLSVLSPCDANELRMCFEWALKQKLPVYMRMGKSDVGSVHKNELKFTNKPIQIIEKSNSKAIVATGSMVKLCQDIIEKNNVDISLYSQPVIKCPEGIDLTELYKFTKIMTAEEHSVYGGLGDLVASELSENTRTQVKKIGIKDQFSTLCGTYQYIMREHGLDEESIRSHVIDWFNDV